MISECWNHFVNALSTEYKVVTAKQQKTFSALIGVSPEPALHPTSPRTTSPNYRNMLHQEQMKDFWGVNLL